MIWFAEQDEASGAVAVGYVDGTQRSVLAMFPAPADVRCAPSIAVGPDRERAAVLVGGRLWIVGAGGEEVVEGVGLELSESEEPWVPAVLARGSGEPVAVRSFALRARAAGEDSYDVNWLAGTVTLEVVRYSTGAFTATCRTAWQTSDFEAFHESLRMLLDDLTGVARFSSVEDQVELSVRLKGGKGTVTGRVEEHAVACTEFEGETDQSYLRPTLAELRALTMKHPFRS